MRKLEYHGPRSLDEALALLEQHAPQVALLSGGTDLVIELRKTPDQDEPLQVVDLTGIEELQTISLSSEQVIIGGGVTDSRTSAFVSPTLSVSVYMPG